MQWLSIVLLSVAMCVVYGIVHDQVTARICVEYFTVAHPPVFHTTDPTLLAFGWGTIATWWVGVILGIPLATAARLGSRPKRSAASLLRPMLVLFAAVGICAVIAGVIGYVAAVKGWIRPTPWVFFAIPQERHVGFFVDCFAHATSYIAGFVGGLFLTAWVWWTRIRLAIQARRKQIV